MSPRIAITNGPTLQVPDGLSDDQLHEVIDHAMRVFNGTGLNFKTDQNDTEDPQSRYSQVAPSLRQFVAGLNNPTITSDIRTPEENALQPGSATNSRHLTGDAIDLALTKDAPSIIAAAQKAGLSAAIHDGNHVHLETVGPRQNLAQVVQALSALKQSAPTVPSPTSAAKQIDAPPETAELDAVSKTLSGLGKIPLEGGKRALSTEQQALASAERGTADLLTRPNTAQMLAELNPLTMALSPFLGKSSDTINSLTKGVKGEVPTKEETTGRGFAADHPLLSNILTKIQQAISPTISAAAPIAGAALNEIPEGVFGAERVAASKALQNAGIKGAELTPGQANPQNVLAQRLENMFKMSAGSGGEARASALTQEGALKGNPITGNPGVAQKLAQEVGMTPPPLGQNPTPLDPQSIHDALQEGFQASQEAAKATYDPLYKQVNTILGGQRFSPSSTNDALTALSNKELPKDLQNAISNVKDALGISGLGKTQAEDLSGYLDQSHQTTTFSKFRNALRTLNQVTDNFYPEEPTSSDKVAQGVLGKLHEAMKTDLDLMAQGGYGVPPEAAQTLQRANAAYAASQDQQNIGPIGRFLGRNFSSDNPSAQRTVDLINRLINGNQYESLGKLMNNVGPEASAPIQHMAATKAMLDNYDIGKMAPQAANLLFGKNGAALVKHAAIVNQATKAATAELQNAGFSIRTMRVPTMIGAPIGAILGLVAHAAGLPGAESALLGTSASTVSGIAILKLMSKAYYNPTVMNVLTTGTPASIYNAATRLLVPLMMQSADTELQKPMPKLSPAQLRKLPLGGLFQQ